MLPAHVKQRVLDNLEAGISKVSKVDLGGAVSKINKDE